MAANASESSRRGQVLVGDLPEDFLRVSATDQQIAADRQTAAYLQSQGGAATGGFAVQGGFATPHVTRLSVTVAQARLNKNYGLVKMDPYARIRVGHSVFETHTSNSGGKNPVWNKVIYAPLPAGVDSVYVEIFDELSFAADSRIAWAHITIPEVVVSGGETVAEWYPLNGRLGDGKEGSVQIILSLTSVAAPAVYGQPLIYALPPGGVGVPQYYAPAPMQPPVVVVQGGGAPIQYAYPPAQQGAMMMPQPGVPYPPAGAYPPQQGPPPAAHRGPAFTEEDVTAVKEMFPNTDTEVVRSVLEANSGDKTATINNLLAMEST